MVCFATRFYALELELLGIGLHDTPLVNLEVRGLSVISLKCLTYPWFGQHLNLKPLNDIEGS